VIYPAISTARNRLRLESFFIYNDLSLQQRPTQYDELATYCIRYQLYNRVVSITYLLACFFVLLYFSLKTFPGRITSTHPCNKSDIAYKSYFEIIIFRISNRFIRCHTIPALLLMVDKNKFE